MNDLAIPFYAGLLSVIALFAVSFVLGVFLRAVYLAFKKSVPVKPEKKARRKRRAKTPSAVRSIEIDPEQIDRIYVKKVS